MQEVISNKRGQQTVGLPFGMIFSIFLVVIFIFGAFYAINGFLSVGRSADIGLFYRDLQETVDETWAGQASELNFEIDLPSKVQRVCFANLSARITGQRDDYEALRDFEIYEANTFLIPPGAGEGLEWKQINHIDIEKITSTDNPYCVSASGSLRVKKDFFDKLVTLS